MLFNTLEFAAFLPVVFAIYWFVLAKHRYAQNLFLLIASYVFYGMWDARFLLLIALSSCVDYFVGQGLDRTENTRARRWLLGASLATNLGILFAFKYDDFFVESAVALLDAFGIAMNVSTFSVILPVGLSFYTFQTLSYSIDVYHRRTRACRDPVAFFTFVGFFPQLVAGPIERANDLLTQFLRNRTFSYEAGRDGLRLILWGLFKKVAVADNCAPTVDAIFALEGDASGATLFVGSVLFAIQIYCDFSGYSEIAIGSAKLLGFELTRNFSFPFFATNLTDFWRRWHITLTSWFRDYVYFPLGGHKLGPLRSLVNLQIVFAASGLWHGATWNHVICGIYCGFTLILSIVIPIPSFFGALAERRAFFLMGQFTKWAITMLSIVAALTIFRGHSLMASFVHLGHICTPSLISHPHQFPTLDVCTWIALCFGLEWIQRRRSYGLDFDNQRVAVWLRWAVYFFVAGATMYSFGREREFVYFQF